jgi:transcription elongation GreA/GreB family factor
MAMSPETNDALKEAVEELNAARETVRLKLNLISLDAKEAWREIETRLHETQNALNGKSEHAAEVSAKSARNLARSIRKFVEKHT